MTTFLLNYLNDCLRDGIQPELAMLLIPDSQANTNALFMFAEEILLTAITSIMEVLEMIISSRQ